MDERFSWIWVSFSIFLFPIAHLKKRKKNSPGSRFSGISAQHFALSHPPRKDLEHGRNQCGSWPRCTCPALALASLSHTHPSPLISQVLPHPASQPVYLWSRHPRNHTAPPRTYTLRAMVLSAAGPTADCLHPWYSCFPTPMKLLRDVKTFSGERKEEDLCVLMGRQKGMTYCL